MKMPLCRSVGKDFVYHACGNEFEPRLKWNFFNFPNHLLWLLQSDYWGMTKWFGAHSSRDVRFSSAVKWKKRPQVITSLLNQRWIYYYVHSIKWLKWLTIPNPIYKWDTSFSNMTHTHIEQQRWRGTHRTAQVWELNWTWHWRSICDWNNC